MDSITFFSVFICLILIAIFVQNRKYRKAKAQILNYYKGKFIFERTKIECSAKYTGLNDRSLNFTLCDLCLIDDAFILFNNELGLTSKPIIISNNILKYKSLFKTSRVYKLREVHFYRNNLALGIDSSQNITITVNYISEKERELIEEKVQENIRY